MIRVELDKSEIPGVVEALERMPNAFVAKVLSRTAVALKNETPDVTGNMTQSIQHNMTGEAQGEVLFDKNYASFVHDGTSGAFGSRGGNEFRNNIQDWMKSKGIGVTKQSLFLISRKIAKEGVKPNPWVNDFVESHRMTAIMQRVVKQVTADVA